MNANRPDKRYRLSQSSKLARNLSTSSPPPNHHAHLDERQGRCFSRAAWRAHSPVLLGFGGCSLVALTSVLNFLGYREAQRSLIGIGILVIAAIAMPLLASEKRKLASVTSSAALRADAAEFA